MSLVHKICTAVGRLSELFGKVIMWLVAVLIVIIAYDVIMRYAFNAPTTWSFTLAYMLGGTISVGGLAYNHLHDVNVRIDIVYAGLAKRRRLLIDVVLGAVLLLPLAIALTSVFAKDAIYAIVTDQRAVETPWYPVIWPYKALLAVGLGLLTLQGLANLVRNITDLFRGGGES